MMNFVFLFSFRLFIVVIFGTYIELRDLMTMIFSLATQITKMLLTYKIQCKLSDMINTIQAI